MFESVGRRLSDEIGAIVPLMNYPGYRLPGVPEPGPPSRLPGGRPLPLPDCTRVHQPAVTLAFYPPGAWRKREGWTCPARGRHRGLERALTARSVRSIAPSSDERGAKLGIRDVERDEGF